MSTVVDTPVVQLDILVQDAQSLVDHQGRQCASQLWEDSTHFGDDLHCECVNIGSRLSTDPCLLGF